jgi:hypothetical protein
MSKWYEEFKATGHTFVERVGRPDGVSSAIGRIAMNFSDLEDQLSVGIKQLLRVDDVTGEIVCAELSFRNKVNLFSSLFRKVATGRKTQGGYEPLEGLSQLVTLCFKAEELRNHVLHSSWIHRYAKRGRVQRRKVTAKAKRGHQVQLEPVSSGYLLDIADYIAYAAFEVEEFMLIVEDFTPPLPDDTG